MGAMRAAARVRALRLKHARGLSAAARTDLASCCLGNYTVGNLPLGINSLGSCHLGKSLWKNTLHHLKY